MESSGSVHSQGWCGCIFKAICVWWKSNRKQVIQVYVGQCMGTLPSFESCDSKLIVNALQDGLKYRDVNST